MKHEERIMAVKSQRPRPPQPTRRRWLPGWVKAVGTAALSAAITYWLCDNVFLSRVPTGLLGKWEVTEGELAGYEMEFYRNGTMRSHVMLENGLPRIDVADVHLADDMLETTFYIPAVGAPQSLWWRIVHVFVPESGAKVTVAQRIIALTPADLVIEDEDGKLIKMVRAR